MNNQSIDQLVEDNGADMRSLQIAAFKEGFKDGLKAARRALPWIVLGASVIVAGKLVEQALINAQEDDIVDSD